MADVNPRMVTLKKLRASFTDSLEELRPTVKGGVPKASVNLILESDLPETEGNKKLILGALKACGEEHWQKPDMFKIISEDDAKRLSYRKGERFKNSETQEVYRGYEGNMVIAASGPGGKKNPRRPVILDRKKTPIWHPERGAENLRKIGSVVYSGCYVDAKVEFYPVSGADNGGNGIFAVVHLIRSREEGERMAGGYAVTESDYDDFDDLESDEPEALSGGDDDFG